MSEPSVLALVGLGGNQGDVAQVFSRALVALQALPATHVTRVSSVYRTPAWGLTAQPDFLNAVAALETALDPPALLAHLLRIERDHGREREHQPRWGPRTLDLDLLLHGALIHDGPGLTLPHPHLHERAFVLVPAAEIAPDLEVPGRGRIDALLAAIDRTGIERIAS